MDEIRHGEPGEAALAQSERSFRTVFERAPIGIAVVDREGHPVICNPALERFLGYSEAEMKAMHFGEFTHPDDLSNDLTLFKELFEGKRNDYRVDKRYVRKDGHIVGGKLTVSILPTSGQAIGIVEDVTQERLKENERERLLHELGERVKELTALHGTARLLQDDSLTVPDILERVALLLPPAFQYPRVTEARLTFDGISAATPGLRSSPWCLQTSAETRHGQKLAIEVFYLERMPQWAEGPFLTEERNLISSMAEMLVVFLDRRQAEEALEKAFEEIRLLKDRLMDENLALKEQIDRSSMFEEIIGASSSLQVTLRLVAQVAPTDSTVLISGETGTGKELIARAVHKSSLRAERPFVSINCAAVPQALIGSELFGHEKGAFTGAMQRRIGRFELAQGGTIFLDEVGELPGETQVALLRVLQERVFERVGGNQTIRADVRVIAATNRDLPAAIRAGTFRSDLYYRLNVFPLHIAPLRERKEDIPLLLEYFLDRFGRKLGKRFRKMPSKALTLLESYSWPGNIRELQNVIERSVIVSDEDCFSVDERWLAETSPALPRTAGPLTPTPEIDVKEMIEAALAATRGQVGGSSGAAAKLGIPPSTLESKIRSLRIDKNRFRNV